MIALMALKLAFLLVTSSSHVMGTCMDLQYDLVSYTKRKPDLDSHLKKRGALDEFFSPKQSVEFDFAPCV